MGLATKTHKGKIYILIALFAFFTCLVYQSNNSVFADHLDENFEIIDGNVYMYDRYGNMVKGWYNHTNGYAVSTWFYFDKETGAMVHNTWKNIDGYYYYFDDWKSLSDDYWRPAEAHTGWLFDNNSWYYLDPISCQMKSNCWTRINGAWYGFWADGSMCKDWVFDHGYNSWFYCDPSTGAVYESCWAWINGKCYGFWAGGYMCTGWVWDSSYHKWYWCDPTTGEWVH